VAGIVEALERDIRDLIQGGEWSKLVTLVVALHPSDVCELAMLLEPEAREQLVRHLPSETLGQLLEFAETDELRALIEAIPTAELPAALDEVDDRVAAEVIQLLEPDEREQTLEQLDRQAEVEEILEYAEDSVGRIMSHGFVALDESMTATAAIEYLRAWKPPADRAYYLYVTGSDGALRGVVSIRDLIVALPETELAEITNSDVHAVTVDTDREDVALTLQKYDLLAIPVIDTEGRLVGVTQADELIDVLAEEATEDMYRMIGLDEDESLFSPVRQTIRLRLPWLVVNLFTAFLGALVVSLFDSTLQKAVVLAAFLPVVANQSGVTGTQSATVMVRTMALRGTSGALRTALMRELVVGFANGLVVGIVLALIAFGFTQNETLAILLLATMTIASSLAAFAGQLVPVVLRSLGADPALASSIFVTMATDALSFLLLLGLAAGVVDQLV
jgi:magnesium transporter